MTRFNGQYWQISAPRLEQEGTTSRAASRVVAEIAGHEIWFESDDVELQAAPEAYASLMFIPALLGSARYRIDAELDSAWLDSTRAVPPLIRDWWQSIVDYPLDHLGSIKTEAEQKDSRAQCFTAGVDSIYALLHDMEKIDALLYVHGFDIDVRDTARMAAFEPSLRQIAEENGKRSIVVRTNLREHPIFSKFSWQKTHGAALAAVGHLMAGPIGHLQIASSWPYKNDQPWGSHWDLDPLWSGRRVAIEHADASLSRYEKIAALANEPMAQQHLRVCWENRAATGNCCRCAKCLRTMLALSIHGDLADFRSFASGINFVQRLDELPYIDKELRAPATEQMQDIRDPEIRSAMERLLARRPKEKFSSKWKAFLKKAGLRK